VDSLLADKAKMVRHKSELQNLLKDVESNIQPTQFRNKMSSTSSAKGKEPEKHGIHGDYSSSSCELWN